MLGDFRLNVFMAVVEHGSFTKAAASLHITQPAVSKNVAELEKELGKRLFDRSHSEVVLTPEGRIFHSYAESLLGKVSAIETLFLPLSPAVIKVSASEEIYRYFLGPAIREFSEIHPETAFERTIFGDCDLALSLRQAVEGASDGEYVISRIRVSKAVPGTRTGDPKTACEITSCFELLYFPSESFSKTETCRILRQFLTDRII